MNAKTTVMLVILAVQLICGTYGALKGFREGRRNGDWTAGMPWLAVGVAGGPLNILVLALWR